MTVTNLIMLSWSRHSALTIMLRCYVHLVQKLLASGLVCVR
ncbi:hypothetical protein Gorai_011168 [Gossypium raimondii]|uniref:Uncharacterized protein n=1 Tax=Gossypium raimondii TaxID=29730 RepID=A0A7J8PYU2_GOSRA|nr:hypothetical protein [Gossypium raimondii]